MRPRFAFTLHRVTPDDAARGEVDPTLALLGAQGWEMRGVSALPDGALIVALQRPLDEEPPLPDESALSEALAQPLAVPLDDER